jgi:hypothetical protein
MSRNLLFAFALLVTASAPLRANEVHYDTTLLQMSVGSSATVFAPQFDPALGVPTLVRVTVSGWVSGFWAVENTAPNPFGFGGGTFYVGTRIPVALPAGSMPSPPNPAFVPYQPVPLGAFDGTVDYAGTSGTILSFAGEQGDGGPNQQANITPGPLLQTYVGTGSINVGVGPITQYSSQLPATLQNFATMGTDVVVRVQYFYEPFPAHFCSPSLGGCPCGNMPTDIVNGCTNSASAQGGRLDAAGNTSIGADSLVLSGSGMTNSSALYFQGTTSSQIPSFYGDGARCVGGSIVRLGTKTNAAGASHYPVAGDLPVSVRGGVTQPGMRYYQVVYRDNATFCTPASFNITSGLVVLWTP